MSVCADDNVILKAEKIVIVQFQAVYIDPLAKLCACQTQVGYAEQNRS